MQGHHWYRTRKIERRRLPGNDRPGRHDRNRANAIIVRYFEGLSRQHFGEMHVSLSDFSLFQQIMDSEALRSALSGRARRIVDIGAGLCELEDLLAANGSLDQTSTIIALDISFNMLRQKPTRRYPFAVYQVVSDAEYCALVSESTDLAFLVNVTPYVAAMDRLILEIARILKVGGYVVLFEPEAHSMFWEAEFDGVAVHLRETDTIISLFQSLGFAFKESRQVCIYPVPGVESIELRIGDCMLFSKSPADSLKRVAYAESLEPKQKGPSS